MNPSIDVQPISPLIDEVLSINVSGLAPHERVSIRSTAMGWQASAEFEADDTGEVDLGKQAPISGSYKGVDPMGLVWSATPAASAPQLQAETTDPLPPVTKLFEVILDDTVIASTTIERRFVADGVTREVVRESGLFGTLFLPGGKGPHPCVTVVSGSGGGIAEANAALYAAHGFASLALAYFNYETLPSALAKIPLEYFGTSIRYLERHNEIDSQHLAITGNSRGGELSLLLGAHFPQYKAVMAIVPSGVAWAGFGGRAEDGVQPTWLINGEPVPFMDGEYEPSDYEYMKAYRDQGKGIPTTPSFVSRLERDAERNARATINVEQINGPVMLISGGDDQLWPSERLSEIVMERLRACEFAHSFEHLCYPDAGHLIDVPYYPTTILEAKHPLSGDTYAYGGDARSNMHASADSWQKRLNLLRELWH